MDNTFVAHIVSWLGLPSVPVTQVAGRNFKICALTRFGPIRPAVANNTSDIGGMVNPGTNGRQGSGGIRPGGCCAVCAGSCPSACTLLRIVRRFRFRRALRRGRFDKAPAL